MWSLVLLVRVLQVRRPLRPTTAMMATWEVAGASTWPWGLLWRQTARSHHIGMPLRVHQLTRPPTACWRFPPLRADLGLMGTITGTPLQAMPRTMELFHWRAKLQMNGEAGEEDGEKKMLVVQCKAGQVVCEVLSYFSCFSSPFAAHGVLDLTNAS
jgi:hypothetical protein